MNFLPRFAIVNNGEIVDTAQGGDYTLLAVDPDRIDFVARCLNAADGMMRATGSISATHIEDGYAFYVSRFDFHITEEQR